MNDPVVPMLPGPKNSGGLAGLRRAVLRNIAALTRVAKRELRAHGWPVRRTRGHTDFHPEWCKNEAAFLMTCDWIDADQRRLVEAATVYPLRPNTDLWHLARILLAADFCLYYMQIGDLFSAYNHNNSIQHELARLLY